MRVILIQMCGSPPPSYGAKIRSMVRRVRCASDSRRACRVTRRDGGAMRPRAPFPLGKWRATIFLNVGTFLIPHFQLEKITFDFPLSFEP